MNRALVLRLSIPQRRLSQVAAPKTTAAETPIVIPKRIPRGPTDILRALASTVKTDYTAPNYKYHDDPLLIPGTTNTKKSYALSRESGRKAARLILEKFPECFTYDHAEPKIPAFNPPAKVFSEDQEYTEEDLVYFIENTEVLNAQSVFNSLKEKGVEVSQETLLSLLQLVSFYNCKEATVDDLSEVQYFRQEPRDHIRTWVKDNLAEQLFEMIEEKNAIAYGALIQGMAKYRHVEKAMDLYEEMCQKGLTPTVYTYNYLIECVHLIRDGEQARVELLQELLSNMGNYGVRPNLHTFNAILSVCPRLGNTKNAKLFALKTLAEMRALGIEPSLATYTGVLHTFCKTRGPISDVLKEILTLINDKTFVLRDKRDLRFFRAAMYVCSDHLVDKDLAYKVNDLMERHSDLIGNFQCQSTIYASFFRLLCSTESFNVYMDVFNKYVPNTCIPDMSIVLDTLQAMELNDAIHYLPQLWSDVIAMNYIDRQKVLSAVLGLTAKFKSSGTPENDELQRSLVNIARQLRNHVKVVENKSRDGFRQPINLSAQDITNLIQTFVNGDAVDDAWTSVKELVDRQSEIIGFPEVGPLRQFTQRACESGMQVEALFCAKYCSEIGHMDVAELMRDNAAKYNLSREVLKQLEPLVSTPSKPSEP